MMHVRENRPLLVITMGDPAGIGPEVVLKALSHEDVHHRCRPLVVGDQRILERAADWIGRPGLDYEVVDAPAGGHYTPDTVALLDLANAAPQDCPPGQVSAAAGRAAVEYVLRACDLVMADIQASTADERVQALLDICTDIGRGGKDSDETE